jgi:mRNA-degrading endonuclease RelE of RelBE toxin-antitoxin system
MRREIVLAPEAEEDIRALKANRRASVRDGMETHLRHEPTKTSRSRVKRLRGTSRPQYRLRIEDVRIFYDVTDEAVEVLAIVPRAQAAAWLKRHAESRKPAVRKNGGTTS